ncbi:hypothetical protein ACOSQ2_004631 [Xanthoceras sorbifolium]
MKQQVDLNLPHVRFEEESGCAGSFDSLGILNDVLKTSKVDLVIDLNVEKPVKGRAHQLKKSWIILFLKRDNPNMVWVIQSHLNSHPRRSEVSNGCHVTTESNGFKCNNSASKLAIDKSIYQYAEEGKYTPSLAEESKECYAKPSQQSSKEEVDSHAMKWEKCLKNIFNPENVLSFTFFKLFSHCLKLCSNKQISIYDMSSSKRDQNMLNHLILLVVLMMSLKPAK